MLEKSEQEQLDKGWITIKIIWGAVFVSLAIYLLICLIAGDQITITDNPDIPLETIEIALYGLSFITLVIAHFKRKALLNTKEESSFARIALNSQGVNQHPAIARYTMATVLSIAISEGVAIYGVIFYFLSKNIMTLYQFLFISALAMIYFRPKKDELINLANKIKTDTEINE